MYCDQVSQAMHLVGYIDYLSIPAEKMVKKSIIVSLEWTEITNEKKHQSVGVVMQFSKTIRYFSFDLDKTPAHTCLYQICGKIQARS